MHQLRNSKASVSEAWRGRGSRRFGQWLECKRAFVGHGKISGFPFGVRGGCMVGFAFEKMTLAL